MIVEQAAGVFLWVELVVRDTLRSFREGEPGMVIEDHIQNSSEELAELLGQLLDRIPQSRHAVVAKYIQLVFASEGMRISLLDLYLAMQDQIAEDANMIETLRTKMIETKELDQASAYFQDLKK